MRITSCILLLATLAMLGPVPADTLIVDRLEQSQQTAAQRPAAGMTMDKVSAKWGAPVAKDAAVGKPPITRWEYNDFVVFFEYDHVIHAVAKQP
jgi:hypothetical protein